MVLVIQLFIENDELAGEWDYRIEKGDSFETAMKKAEKIAQEELEEIGAQYYTIS